MKTRDRTAPGCFFDRATFKEVLPLILTEHYARRRCADPSSVFVIRNEDYDIMAAAVFAAPANRYFGRKAIELVRLVRKPSYHGALSSFIAFCLGELKKEKRFFYCLSYADTDANHHGGIYQACSFAYVGLSKGHTMYKRADGAVVSARSRDQSTVETKKLLLPFKTGPKHLYIRGLLISTQDAVARLGREKLPYPKPLA